MQIDIGRLWAYTEDGWLRHGSHPTRDLHVWTYSIPTVYTRKWDDLTTMCRGLVTDQDGTVISRPFPKFFNWGDDLGPGPEITRGPFWAYDKEDGSLIVVGLDVDGEPVVSTKGSFTTWHSEEARKMLGDWKPKAGMTGIFEFVHPGNRIVLDYDGFEGLILLGAVDNETGEDHFTPDDFADVTGWTGRLAVPRSFHLPSMVQTVANPENGENREGFVLVWPTPDGPSPRVKLKFAQYVTLHAALSRLNNVVVWEALSNGTFDAMLEMVPDEIFDKVRECADELNDEFNRQVALVDRHVSHVQSNFITRKDQAEWILANAEDSALVFAALDQKPMYEQMIWAHVKPERDTSWTFLK